MTHAAADRSGAPKSAAPPAESVRQFYASVVDDAAELLEADEVQGLDRELAMLRVRLRRQMRDEGADYALMLKSIETITKLVAARYRMSRQRSEDLAGSMTETLDRMTDAIFGGDAL